MPIRRLSVLVRYVHTQTPTPRKVAVTRASAPAHSYTTRGDRTPVKASFIVTATFAVLMAACAEPENASSSEDNIVGSIPDSSTVAPALLLRFGSQRCTGQHIGGGIILTAAHCFWTMQEMVPVPRYVSIQDGAGALIAKLNVGEYELKLPTLVDNPEMSIAPQPDLAIIAPNEARQTIANLPAVNIDYAEVEPGEELYIAGYGESRFMAGIEAPKLRVGKANIETINDIFYILYYDNKSESASAAPGDSGGPLFSTKDGVVHLRGVASTVQTGRTDRGDYLSYSRYTRVNAAVAREFIEATRNELLSTGSDGTRSPAE